MWTKELLLEQVVRASSDHGQLAGRPAMPELGLEAGASTG